MARLARQGKVQAKSPKNAAGVPKVFARGRPSVYTDEMAEFICEKLVEGNSLAEICELDGVPSYTTVLRWLSSRDEFRVLYARARKVQPDTLFDSMLKVSRDRAIPSDEKRVQLDTIKWMIGKMAPKKYGDKQQLQIEGTEGGPITTVDLSKLTHEELKAFYALRSKLADA